MGIERQITITTKAGGSPRITFTPGSLPANVADQVFWTNNDTQPHWPGLVVGSDINKTFFMPNQIAPNGNTSSVFSPGQPGPLTYKCSLEGHQDETGTIVVTSS